MLLRWRALVQAAMTSGGFVVNGVTDWTGCPLARPPTSGFAAQFGQQLWRRRRHECSGDSSEAVDVSQRRGSGKTRHLEAGCLWIQSAIKKAGRSTV